MMCFRCNRIGDRYQFNSKRFDLGSMCKECLKDIEDKENDVKLLVLLIIGNIRNKYDSRKI